ncbi:metallophosphoesterase [Archangium violaceum]|uniref:metallophosphoesterase n=1 Tax=Archangium violaceum TaxID=83451 RepID=UPI00193BA01B|nr:metallophosphoesterase [Archangium violaceum]QRK10165.1 metallophosphoesterase [Archangium violaceum]
MSTPRIEAALARATEAAHRGPHSAPPDGHPRPRHLAIGDPQADITRFLAVLDRHGLLGADGWLRPEVQLVSVGDHFDWGKAHEREEMATSALRLVAWMAAHPADQAVLLLGNHDLGRVGELAGFTDARFAAAQARADLLYRGDDTDEASEREFLSHYPEVPNVELVARDFGNFREIQRDWVAWLLRAGRFRVAHAAAEHLLVLHAGVTREDLHLVGVPESLQAHAPTVADTLNRALDEAVADWKQGPFSIPGLHHPGSAAYGEGRGIFYQRASLLPEDAPWRAATPRRRFDPYRLPPGLVQVVGHTRDKRSRELLMLPLEETRDGVLRHLVTDGTTLHYRHGPPPPTGPGEAVLVFTDGGMRESPLERFELFDLDAREPARPMEDAPRGGQG